MIKIITDSACNITNDEALKLGIEIIPLTINFENEEYADGKDLSLEDFYDRLKDARTLPTTSQISPAAFEDCFRKYIDAGDQIIGIFISSELSGTFQSANIAAMNIESDNIFLIDSKNVSIGEGLIVKEAVKYKNAGLSAPQIVDLCQDFLKRVCVLAVVDTLKYLKMGGRLSTAGAAIGSLLHIVPVFSVIDGKIAVIAKSRGAKSAIRALSSYMHESDIDTNINYSIGHANSIEKAAAFSKVTADAIGKKCDYITQMSAAIGTHLGPGTLAVAYVKKGIHAAVSSVNEISA